MITDEAADGGWKQPARSKKESEIDHWQEVIISDVIKEDCERVTFECINERGLGGARGAEVAALLSRRENANAEGLDTA